MRSKPTAGPLYNCISARWLIPNENSFYWPANVSEYIADNLKASHVKPEVNWLKIPHSGRTLCQNSEYLHKLHNSWNHYFCA